MWTLLWVDAADGSTSCKAASLRRVKFLLHLCGFGAEVATKASDEDVEINQKSEVK